MFCRNYVLGKFEAILDRSLLTSRMTLFLNPSCSKTKDRGRQAVAKEALALDEMS